jgi:hypothetical protein
VSEQTALAAQIRAELREIEKAVGQTERLLGKAEATSDEDWWSGVALSIHSFYNGAERILESIARDLDGWAPRKAEWHRELLLLMNEGVVNGRPPVISEETLRCLNRYRAFRHVVRHLYVFDLQPPRVRELAEGLRDCHEFVKRDLLAFCQFLEQE